MEWINTLNPTAGLWVVGFLLVLIALTILGALWAKKRFPHGEVRLNFFRLIVLRFGWGEPSDNSGEENSS
jgi:hypothetical protein